MVITARTMPLLHRALTRSREQRTRGIRIQNCAIPCAIILLLTAFSLSLISQNAGLKQPPRPASSSKSDSVIVDVVVTDKNNHPVTALERNDFVVFEGEAAIRPDVLVPTGERIQLKGNSEKDAASQWRVSSFEAHPPQPIAMVWVHDVPPPNSYTNAPLVEPATSINVLLLDGLNTTSEDQKAARLRMLKYLETIDPGPRLAIFTLRTRLRMVEGFTSDPHLLLGKLKQKWGKPGKHTSADDNPDETLQPTMDAEPGTGGIDALEQFLEKTGPLPPAARTSLTFDALQVISRYLSAFHGRKSLIWLSGSFPQVDFPAFGDSTRIGPNSSELSKKMKETINLLATARVAVYPVAVQALDSGTGPESQHPPGGKPPSGKSDSEQQGRVASSFDTRAADDIAKNTGGQAFFNRNGLDDALAKATQDGEYYYKLSYSPIYKTMAGRYRHIEIKVHKGWYGPPYTLEYRRGYYEEDQSRQGRPGAASSADSLQSLMAKGLPEATQLTYNLRLLPSRKQPAPGSARIGDNKDLSGPVTRFSADFAIPVDNFSFEVTPDSVRHGRIELALVAYDRQGKPLNWIVRSIQTSLKLDTYPSVEKAGVQFHQDIDVPNGDDLYLRSGIYDFESDKAGTLEIPLSDITSAEDLATRIRRVFGGLSQATASSGSPEAQAPPGSHAEVSSRAAEVPDVPAYCATLAGTVQHSSALAKVCEFALSMRKKLPDIICDRETKRHWVGFHEYQINNQPATFSIYGHSDVITVTVTYRNSGEFYDNVRINGKPVGAGGAEVSGTWSDGEFAPILAGIFVPSSKAEFHYEKEQKLHSIPALVFRYHVKAQDNTLYVLQSGKYIWFPEYDGEIWLDAKTLRLLRLERETALMPRNPIRRMKTQIDYSDVPLGDGTRLVLPTHSDVLICTPLPPYFDDSNCAHNIIRFNHWHKFRATTKIVMQPGN
jgi:VWFA-related protein